MPPELGLEDRLSGVLLGAAVGDALGLPYEGMSRVRVRRMLKDRPLAHRFLFGRGMLSDNAELSCTVAQALAETAGDTQAFERALAWKLRSRLLGAWSRSRLGTLRGIAKLWLGSRSDVGSAGSGTAVLGAYAADDDARLRALVRAATRLTHADPRIEHGALAVALAAALAARGPLEGAHGLLLQVRELLPPGEMAEVIERAAACADDYTSEFADAIGLSRGVTGFVLHAVPVALHAWARQPDDLETALTEVIRLGGDTHTTGAIVGALVGATTGQSGIPRDWLDGLLEWPRSVPWMLSLGRALARGGRPPRLVWGATLPRCALFAAALGLNFLRRALPPY